MDIAVKECIALIIELLCGIALVALLSFAMYAGYMIPLLERLF